MADRTVDKRNDRSKPSSCAGLDRPAPVERDYSDFVTFNYGYAYQRAKASEGLDERLSYMVREPVTQKIS